MSGKVNEALRDNLPLIMRFVDDDEYDDLEDDQDVE